MRKYFVSAFVLAALLMFATSGLALEKTAVRGVETKGDWNAGTSSCSVGYYNICTGYIWVWSGWAANSVMGTVYDTCCLPGQDSNVTSTFFYYRTGAPASYGFTGTASLTDVDANDCPTATLASQPILPASGWNFLLWGTAVPARFAQVHVIADNLAFGSPVTVATDGAGGACGVCFPTTRTTNSYTWGTTGSPLCPGFAMNDGACNVEFLTNATLVCAGVSVEDESWGSIKNLYR